MSTKLKVYDTLFCDNTNTLTQGPILFHYNSDYIHNEVETILGETGEKNFDIKYTWLNYDHVYGLYLYQIEPLMIDNNDNITKFRIYLYYTSDINKVVAITSNNSDLLIPLKLSDLNSLMKPRLFSLGESLFFNLNGKIYIINCVYTNKRELNLNDKLVYLYVGTSNYTSTDGSLPMGLCLGKNNSMYLIYPEFSPPVYAFLTIPTEKNKFGKVNLINCSENLFNLSEIYNNCNNLAFNYYYDLTNVIARYKSAQDLLYRLYLSGNWEKDKIYLTDSGILTYRNSSINPRIDAKCSFYPYSWRLGNRYQFNYSELVQESSGNLLIKNPTGYDLITYKDNSIIKTNYVTNEIWRFCKGVQVSIDNTTANILNL